jgi:pimeloyl-ACP methyl ester carboxylesterase
MPEEITWEWTGEAVRLGLDRLGQGPPILLLPALSSISTRRELRPLQERLAVRYATSCVDWPGFGDRARPRIDWTPAAYSAFLSFLFASVVPRPCAIIAAGHAATYALKHVVGAPQAASRLVMIAPTWRGPLPTMMGGRRSWFDRLCRLVDLPGLGPAIYRLNVNRLVVRYMAAGHVFTHPAFLKGERLHDKLAVIRAPGARFASARFVTGRLDPLDSRDEFLALARRAPVPILLVYGAETPPRSRAEMAALAALPGLRNVRLSRGKLSVHEEFPDAVMEAIGPFLNDHLDPAAAR